MKIKKIICKSLGNKISENDKESDLACYLRVFYAFIMVLTSFFIILNVFLTHFL